MNSRNTVRLLKSNSYIREKLEEHLFNKFIDVFFVMYRVTTTTWLNFIVSRILWVALC